MNALNPVIRVGDQVAEPAILHLGVKKEQALELVQKMFQHVGVPEDFLGRYPFELSGGMRGVLAILVGLFLIIIKRCAYVQVFPLYLKLVTPFLRLKISYKRVARTTSTEMRLLFPPKSMSWWIREIFAPLSTMTTIVIDLNSYPVSPRIMRLFLSRFFFKDKTPHFVILVKDWMLFSTELDIMRTNTNPDSANRQKRPPDSILSRLPQK